MKNVKIIKVELIQVNDNQKRLTFTGEVNSEKISEVASTIAGRIVKLYMNAKVFKQKLNFTFAHKFDLAITIDGEKLSGTDLLNGAVKFGITVQSNRQSIIKFAKFVEHLTIDIMSGANMEIIEADEILAIAKEVIE